MFLTWELQSYSIVPTQLFISKEILQIIKMNNPVNKYTKYCNAQILIRAIQASQKDEAAMHILLSVFKKPLRWLQEKYKRQGMIDAIKKISIREGAISQELAWIYTIKDSFKYYGMPFYQSEHVVLNGGTQNYLQYSDQAVYAVLTQQNCKELADMQEARQREQIKKFIKSNVFYPYYLQDIYAQQFISLVRVKKLGFNSILSWKDEDRSQKIGVVYKGLLSLEYSWKRRLELTQITRGMYISNHYIKDQMEQIQQYQLESIDSKPKRSKQLPKYRYVSKSDQTVLLIFNVRLIKEQPYNVNPQILLLIKKNYEKYENIIDKNMQIDNKHKLHRNKSSIKEQIKKKQIKQTFKRNVSLSLSKTSSITSPILRTFHTLQIQTTPFETTRTIDIPQPSKSYSKAISTAFSPIKYKQQRSESADRSKSHSSRRLIHNTWVEQELNRKKPKVKSFSTLHTISTYHPERHKKQADLKEDIEKEQTPAFFVPNQFVKKKLRMKYQTLINKVRKMDLSPKRDSEDAVTFRMQKLQDYIESKRIVKISNAKNKKFRLLRDKVQY